MDTTLVYCIFGQLHGRKRKLIETFLIRSCAFTGMHARKGASSHIP